MEQRFGFTPTDVNWLSAKIWEPFSVLYVMSCRCCAFLVNGILFPFFFNFTDSCLFCWQQFWVAERNGEFTLVVLSSLKFHWEGITLQNLWWRTVGTKQLHFYSNTDFVAGDKYSFIACGWALCSGEPNSSGPSNHLTAQLMMIIILFFIYKPSQKRFQIVTIGKIQQDKCLFMCENLFLLEVTISIRNDPFNDKFIIYLVYIWQCSQTFLSSFHQLIFHIANVQIKSDAGLHYKGNLEILNVWASVTFVNLTCQLYRIYIKSSWQDLFRVEIFLFPWHWLWSCPLHLYNCFS